MHASFMSTFLTCIIAETFPKAYKEECDIYGLLVLVYHHTGILSVYYLDVMSEIQDIT